MKKPAGCTKKPAGAAKKPSGALKKPAGGGVGAEALEIILRSCKDGVLADCLPPPKQHSRFGRPAMPWLNTKLSTRISNVEAILTEQGDWEADQHMAVVKRSPGYEEVTVNIPQSLCARTTATTAGAPASRSELVTKGGMSWTDTDERRRCPLCRQELTLSRSVHFSHFVKLKELQSVLILVGRFARIDSRLEKNLFYFLQIGLPDNAMDCELILAPSLLPFVVELHLGSGSQQHL